VIGGAVGSRLRRSLTARSLPLSADVLGGAAVVLLIRFAPVVGGWVWTLVSVAAFGVGLMTVVIATEGGSLILREGAS